MSKPMVATIDNYGWVGAILFRPVWPMEPRGIVSTDLGAPLMGMFPGRPSAGRTKRRSGLITDQDLSFDDFYRAEADGLYRALALALGNPDLAQEAAHEGLARAYQKWNKISSYQSPAGWTYRVGLNWGRSRLRKTGNEVLTHTPERAPVTHDIDPDLRAALSRLSVDARAVVVLRYLLEWSTIDTAAALGVAEGTVKSRLARALAELEQMLTETEKAVR